MTGQITQTYRRIENALGTALALAWFGLLGDRDVPETAPVTSGPLLTAPNKKGHHDDNTSDYKAA